MTLPRSFLITLLIAFVLASVGCTTVGTKGLDDVGNFLNLKKGISTKDDVYATFGQPGNVEYQNGSTGTSRWTYFQSRVSPNGWSYVPYVGILAGGQNQETTKAFISFDATGKFTDVHTSKDSTYVNGLYEIGTAIAGRSRNQVQRVQDEMKKLGKPFDLKLARNVGEVRYVTVPTR